MVGALCNNAIGVCGVNQKVRVMGCKFLDGSGNGCALSFSHKMLCQIVIQGQACCTVHAALSPYRPGGRSRRCRTNTRGALTIIGGLQLHPTTKICPMRSISILHAAMQHGMWRADSLWGRLKPQRARVRRYTSDAVRCLDYALRMGADITLNSYGGLYADSQALQATIAATEARGQLFVTAAGNDYGLPRCLPRSHLWRAPWQCRKRYGACA